MRIEKKIITPKMAQEFLNKSNTLNRSKSNPSIIRYANDMKDGKWKDDTGEMIKISEDGNILDGQHRLSAVVKSGVSIPFHIAYDVKQSVFDVLDTGKSRNASDCFKIAGIKKDNLLPSVISFYNALMLGNGNRNVQINHKSTNAETLLQYNEDPIFWDNIATVAYHHYANFQKILAPSFIGGFLAFFTKLNSSKSDEFISQLCTGDKVTNDVILLLRNKFIEDRMSVRKIPMNHKMAFTIKAWNSFVTNKKIKILKYSSIIEDFPIALQ